MLAMLATDVAAREVWPSCSSPACDPPFTFGAVMLIRELTLLQCVNAPVGTPAGHCRGPSEAATFGELSFVC